LGTESKSLRLPARPPMHQLPAAHRARGGRHPGRKGRAEKDVASPMFLLPGMQGEQLTDFYLHFNRIRVGGKVEKVKSF
jgi:hypothetical protein